MHMSESMCMMTRLLMCMMTRLLIESRLIIESQVPMPPYQVGPQPQQLLGITKLALCIGLIINRSISDGACQSPL